MRKGKLVWLIVTAILLIWVVLTIVLVKTNASLFVDVGNYDKALQYKEELLVRANRDRDNWKISYRGSIEGQMEKQAASEFEVSFQSVRVISLGKDFKGVLVVDKNGKSYNYSFFVRFDRNGLPILADLSML